MSEKVSDFKKETQSEINCILPSKMNLLKGIFFEKSSRSSFYLDFEENVWEFVIKVSEMTSQLHFSCPQHHFECKKLSFEKTFFRFSLIKT